MNILISSIGQRDYLVGHFKESAANKIGIYGADASRYAPALQKADRAFVIPMANDPNYYPELLKVCLRNDIGGIVSINDLELPVLARHREDFRKHSIMAVVSDEDVVDICFDKYRTYKFCLENGISVPLTYLWNDSEKMFADISSGKLAFPVIAKPRKGSRSVGIHIVYDAAQLQNDIDMLEKQTIPENEKLMFQEYIDSEQYSIHVFNDAEFNPVSVVTMVNILRHFGETFHIRTFKDEKLISLGETIGKKLKHLGPLSADVHRRENGEYVVLEFNPRISGCYSLSHYAGADFTGKILKLVQGEPICADKPGFFEDGVIMLKQFTTQKISEEDIDRKLHNKTDSGSVWPERDD